MTKSRIEMKKTSVSRSFRLEGKVLGTLEEEAARQEVTISALVSRVLRKYVEFGRYAEKYGYLHIPGYIVTKIAASLTKEQLESLSRDMATVRPFEFLHQRNKPITVGNLIEYLANHMTRDCGYGTAEVQLEGGVWNVTLSSPWGIGFTSWARYYIPAVLKNVLGIETKVLITETTVHFSVPDTDTSQKAPGTRRRDATLNTGRKTEEKSVIVTEPSS